MVLLILPLIGIIGMVAVLVSDAGSGDESEDEQIEQVERESGVINTPRPVTLPPFTPTPTEPAIVSPTPPPTNPPYLNNPVPDVVLRDLEGNTYPMTEFAGRQVIVNFWATWCLPCREELPLLADYSATQGEEGPLVIAVTDVNSGDQDLEVIREYVEEIDLELLFLLDDELRLHNALGVFALPTTYFVDENGVVRGRVLGIVDAQRLDAEREALFERQRS
jgi:thiol-disulfide isomerase/thioredoxin